MSIVLCVIGDVMIGRSFNKELTNNPGMNIWGDTKTVLDTSHLILANLETTLTSNISKADKTKQFNFHLDPQHAGILKNIGIDYVNLANNHILDYGTRGLTDTLNTLDNLNIAYSGVGSSISESQQPAVFKIKLIPNTLNEDVKYNRIAIFGAADHYSNWLATNTKSGIWYFHHTAPENALAFLRNYRQKHSKTFIILSYHWGPNYTNVVEDWKRKLAVKLFESGVDLILGHSAHHTQPFEKINGKYVFYSLGDFIDDYAIDPIYRNDLGMIARLSLDLVTGKITSVEKYTTIIQNLQVNLY